MPVTDVKVTMEGLGESVIAVGDEELLRVHVHTLRPGQALEFAVDHGTLAKVKVENMQLQRDAFAATSGGASGPTAESVAASSIGVIAVAAGDGLLNVFRSLGAAVVHGGQTMNPSVQDILAAVNSSGFKSLIILPNNGNIVMTASHVKEMTPHTVEVVPTETVPQGIGALLAFNFQADIETNVAAMQQAAHAVHTIEVTTAVRDADIDGITVKAGQAMGIYDGQVAVAAAAPDQALLETLARASLDALEIVTIYYGAGVAEADAQAISAKVRASHAGLAVEIVPGGQPHYPFVVSLE
jgi:dihydroxyacetone kinase-like predicted kinase